MKKPLYIVNAYRYGNREGHSYTVGIFDGKHDAKKCADAHTIYRGGKYACTVEQCELNGFDNDLDHYTNEIYKTKSSF